jgi:hypothetical protein
LCHAPAWRENNLGYLIYLRIFAASLTQQIYSVMDKLFNTIQIDLNDIDFNEYKIKYTSDTWKQQVPKEIQNVWNELTENEKKLVYIMANKLDDVYWENVANETIRSI